MYENGCQGGSLSVERIFIHYISSEEALTALTRTRVAFYSFLLVASRMTTATRTLNIFLAGIFYFLNDNNARNNSASLYGGHKH